MTDAKKKSTGMLSYPTSLKIGPYDYTIETIDNLNDKVGQLFGQHDPETNTIRINGSITNEQIKAETLWHEILHAIWNVFHIGSYRIGEDAEEFVVANLATGTMMVLRDNPELRKYLCGILK